MYEVMSLNTGTKYTVDAQSETDALRQVWSDLYPDVEPTYSAFEENDRKYETAEDENIGGDCLCVRVYGE